jgi:hypothetical protein
MTEEFWCAGWPLEMMWERWDCDRQELVGIIFASVTFPTHRELEGGTGRRPALSLLMIGQQLSGSVRQ